MKRTIIAIVASLTLFSSFNLINNVNSANAAQLSGYSLVKKVIKKQVIVTKKMKLYRCKIGQSESQNHFYRSGYVKKGQKIWVSSWLMSSGEGRIVMTKNKQAGDKTFYFVPCGENEKWYENISTYKKQLKQQDADNSFKKFLSNKNHLIGSPKYKYTDNNDDLSALNFSVYKNNTIYENKSPLDSDALVPQGFKPKMNMYWVDNITNKVYSYITDANEQFPGLNSENDSGWFYYFNVAKKR